MAGAAAEAAEELLNRVEARRPFAIAYVAASGMDRTTTDNTPVTSDNYTPAL